jgi:sterol desaturase/sphingolipid hydroxylase (fatty acid hydroxylase superfamily)
MAYCKECGQELERGTKFCPKCGTRVSKLSTRATKEPLKEKETKKEPSASKLALHWAIAAIILYVASAILFALWWNVYSSIEVRYFGAPEPIPPFLGIFFLIVALVCTGIAAENHYRA